ncbi:DinB family protein [Spirillospora sp. NPDC127200]
MNDTRIEPPREGGEPATLHGFLDYQRETLAMKCAGLTAGQLRERAVPPSTLTLLGLVRHMVDVEWNWFQKVIGGAGGPRPWGLADDGTLAFDAEDADPDEVFAAWRAECERSRVLVAAAESLEVTGLHRTGVVSLRWVLCHMIEEYARHNGHADLLRERIDGATGE